MGRGEEAQMRDHDAADDPRACCQDNPIDRMEPREMADESPEQAMHRLEREAYREAGGKMLVFLHSSLAFIHEAGNESERNIRLWAVSSSVDHPACDGRPDSDIASMLGTTRANFSKHKLAFQRQNSLPPTLSQKSVEARSSYRKSREKQLNGNPV